jgi:hypothetical protein
MASLLRQLNAIRVAFDNAPLTELVKGDMGDTQRCPIAMSLANGWEPNVGDEITMTNRAGFTRHEGIAICRKLTQAGFKCVLYDAWGYSMYPKNEQYEDDPPNNIQIQITKTMDNFITRFDNGEFESLIKGRNGNSVL